MAIFFLQNNNTDERFTAEESFEFNNSFYKLDNFRSIFEEFYSKFNQMGNCSFVSFDEIIEFFSGEKLNLQKRFLDIYFLNCKSESIMAFSISQDYEIYTRLKDVYFNFIDRIYSELSEKDKKKYNYENKINSSIKLLIRDKLNHIHKCIKLDFILGLYELLQEYISDSNIQIQTFSIENKCEQKNNKVISYFYSDYIDMVKKNIENSILQNEDINIHYKEFSTNNDFKNLLDNELERKNRALKLFIYFVLSNYKDVEVPWGALTGIRPTYVAGQVLATVKHEIIKEKMINKEVDRGSAFFCQQILQNIYFIKKAKAKLAIDVAKRESELLSKLDSDIYCVYIHIPFCDTRCSYCSFPAKDGIACNRSMHRIYIDCLLYELRSFFANFTGNIFSIYIGGGTPSVFDDDLLEYFLSELNGIIDIYKINERNFEAGRIDSLNTNKIEIIASANFDRICINPQSMQEKTLHRINRYCDLSLMKEYIDYSRHCGIKSINSDLIAGLPGEDAEDFLASVEALLDLNLDTITLHSLALKRKSNLFDRHIYNRMSSVNNRRDSGMKKRVANLFNTHIKVDHTDIQYFTFEEAFDVATKILEGKGYNPYYLYRNKYSIEGLENVSFSKEEHYCLYNILMMNDQTSVIAFGAGAMSKKFFQGKITRFATAATVSHYISNYADNSLRRIEFFN